uniref:THAP domain-containing protein 9 n=1 Tax=Pararge aegeria TaxID=116150 RepID=S4P342_9NEOP
MQCSVPTCETTADTISEADGITFHEFPNEGHLRNAWLKALGIQVSPLPDSAVVCSMHFLYDDIDETESGLKEIRSGAIPSTVQVCMMCLETNGKLFEMSKYKLEAAYERLMGQSLCDQGKLNNALCTQCLQLLVKFSSFRDKALSTRSMLMELGI